MISDEIGLTIMNDCDFGNKSKSCKDALDEANKIVGKYVDYYDVILDKCYPFITEQQMRLRNMVSFVSYLLYFNLF